MKETVLFSDQRQRDGWLKAAGKKGAKVLRAFTDPRGQFCADLEWPAPTEAKAALKTDHFFSPLQLKPKVKATEPPEYAHVRLLAGRWHHTPPITAFSRYVEQLLVDDPKLSTADAYCIGAARKPDLFASECAVRDAIIHKKRAESVERLDDREALRKVRGW